MKGVLVVIDGMGDLANKSLKGKTPLEAAKKPNLDYLASNGKLGEMISLGEGIIPESDSGVLAILGNEKTIGYRGEFEAIGAGLKIERGDVALRINFATIDSMENRKIVDRRVGRTLTTKEAMQLADAINKNVKINAKFVFKSTIQHRGVLVLKGGFSANVSNIDPAYHTNDKNQNVFHMSKALDEEEDSKLTANILNEFLEQSHKILQNHPVNKERIKKKLLPANFILMRDAASEIPQIKKFHNWAAMVYQPLEIGICNASGIKVFSFPYPDMKGDVYASLNEGLKEACNKAIEVFKAESEYDYLYLHFKETDVPGHDNLPQEKKKMLEFLDKHLFGFLKDECEKKKIAILITADHATPCSLSSHSADPVPVLLCDWQKARAKASTIFSEKDAKKGELGRFLGKELLKKAGFC